MELTYKVGLYNAKPNKIVEGHNGTLLGFSYVQRNLSGCFSKNPALISLVPGKRLKGGKTCLNINLLRKHFQ